jgi:hypothetical protein
MSADPVELVLVELELAMLELETAAGSVAVSMMLAF